MSYKLWLLIAAALFCAGLVAGLAVPVDSAGTTIEGITEFEEMAEFLSSFPQAAVFIFIFLKNVTAILISFILSPVFCIVPVLALLLNGSIIGLLSTLVIQEKSLGYLLAGLLPHGVLEIPALLMGETVALSSGLAVILALFSKERRKLVLPNLRHNLKYLLISLGLFLPAAIIETYITPLLL
jgi:stage II sporulation protein M